MKFDPIYENTISFVFSAAMIFLVIAGALLSSTIYLRREYLAFKALGPGGTPQTLAGFAKIFLLSFLKVSNPYEPPICQSLGDQRPGYLRNLPLRKGARPETRGIAPHRQVTQQGSEGAYEFLVADIERFASSSKGLFIWTSCFEKHSTGLFALHPVNNTCGGEICHTHPSDGGSMHLTLHPADVKVVLERGWGERHPLSRGGWFQRFVPAGFVMVYAPRDEREVGVVMETVAAAAWYVRGGDESETGSFEALLQAA